MNFALTLVCGPLRRSIEPTGTWSLIAYETRTTLLFTQPGFFHLEVKTFGLSQTHGQGYTLRGTVKGGFKHW